MAKVTGTKASKSASTGDDNDRPVSSKRISFSEVVEWINGLERSDTNTRVAAILTTDSKAPEFHCLRFSYPPVKIGKITGYEKPDGSIILKQN